MFLSLFLFFLNFFLSFKNFFFNKVRIFESGFTRIFKVQISFSIHFFIIVILFILFDLELILLVGLLMRRFVRGFIFLILIFFIFLGFYLEWLFGKLI